MLFNASIASGERDEALEGFFDTVGLLVGEVINVATTTVCSLSLCCSEKTVSSSTHG